MCSSIYEFLQEALQPYASTKRSYCNIVGSATFIQAGPLVQSTLYLSLNTHLVSYFGCNKQKQSLTGFSKIRLCCKPTKQLKERNNEELNLERAGMGRVMVQVEEANWQFYWAVAAENNQQLNFLLLWLSVLKIQNSRRQSSCPVPWLAKTQCVDGSPVMFSQMSMRQFCPEETEEAVFKEKRHPNWYLLI